MAHREEDVGRYISKRREREARSRLLDCLSSSLRSVTCHLCELQHIIQPLFALVFFICKMEWFLPHRVAMS